MSTPRRQPRCLRRRAGRPHTLLPDYKAPSPDAPLSLRTFGRFGRDSIRAERAVLAGQNSFFYSHLFA